MWYRRRGRGGSRCRRTTSRIVIMIVILIVRLIATNIITLIIYSNIRRGMGGSCCRRTTSSGGTSGRAGSRLSICMMYVYVCVYVYVYVLYKMCVYMQWRHKREGRRQSRLERMLFLMFMLCQLLYICISSIVIIVMSTHCGYYYRCTSGRAGRQRLGQKQYITDRSLESAPTRCSKFWLCFSVIYIPLVSTVEAAESETSGRVGSRLLAPMLFFIPGSVYQSCYITLQYIMLCYVMFVLCCYVIYYSIH